jgi:hypothetical protein
MSRIESLGLTRSQGRPASLNGARRALVNPDLRSVVLASRANSLGLREQVAMASEYDWRLAAITIADIVAEAVSIGVQAGSSIDEQIAFILFTDVITTKLKLKRETNSAFVDGMPEVMAILRDHRQALDAIAEALMAEPELGRDRLDPLLAGGFDPGWDRAAEFIARLRAGPSQAAKDFATWTALQRQGGRMQPTN